MGFSFQSRPFPTSSLSCYHTRIFLTVFRVSVHAFALFKRTRHQANCCGHFAGRAEARHSSLSPRLFCIRFGEQFVCVPLPTPKAEQSSIPTVLFILLRALLYTTTFHDPITQPASVTFHDPSHETFLPRQPLYWHLSNSTLHCW